MGSGFRLFWGMGCRGLGFPMLRCEPQQTLQIPDKLSCAAISTVFLSPESMCAKISPDTRRAAGAYRGCLELAQVRDA